MRGNAPPISRLRTAGTHCLLQGTYQQCSLMGQSSAQRDSTDVSSPREPRSVNTEMEEPVGSR